MATEALVSVEEYLSTSYHPGCDYVDGVIRQRNWGEYDHARLHAAAGTYFSSREKQWSIRAVIEQRVQVSPTRFRIPDVCVFLGEPGTPPFLCIEILSPEEDRLMSFQERMNDYLAFGVPYVFHLDPHTRKAFRWTTAGMTEVPELRTANPEFVVPLVELFE